MPARTPAFKSPATVIEREASRRAVLTGLGSILGLAAGTGQALPAGVDPPPFQTRVAQFIVFEPALAAPAIRLERIDGKLIDLAGFRGKAVLVNFWATWCPPCRRELPLLAELQEIVRSEPLEIVAISIDKEGSRAVQPFLERLNIKRLRPYLDPRGQIAKGIGDNGPAPFVLYGLPISYIIDRDGCVAGYLVGEADWTSSTGRALLRYYTMG
ncbi:TlpA disulfide reductase family protein [Methylocapsa aurea]|uniref:TlpA disulfide reductase family protein n=1 Tax=Methylocapsa aurea TaxID=663610 RepID=UPI00138E4A0A|nr:TlpA disulfide reductase family protein [Methylocapsa aurea]